MKHSRVSLLFLPVFLALGVWAWLTDFVTIQGEATVYTVECSGGQWRGELCTGTLVPADRFRFRALPRRREVLFWTPGRDEPSGRFSGCQIEDGRNWTCPGGNDAARTIAVGLMRGRALHDPSGHARPFHAVFKWRWLLLQWGVSTGNSADY